MQQHGLQMAALSSTRLDMCQTPQQTAEMNPSHCKLCQFPHDQLQEVVAQVIREHCLNEGVDEKVDGGEEECDQRTERHGAGLRLTVAQQVHRGDQEQVGHADGEGGEVAEGADHVPDVPAKFRWFHEISAGLGAVTV